MADQEDSLPALQQVDPVLLQGLIHLLSLHQEGMQKVTARIGGAPPGVSLEVLNTHIEYLKSAVSTLQIGLKELQQARATETREDQKEAKADDRSARALRIAIIGMIVSGIFGLASFIFALISMVRH